MLSGDLGEDHAEAESKLSVCRYKCAVEKGTNTQKRGVGGSSDVAYVELSVSLMKMTRKIN